MVDARLLSQPSMDLGAVMAAEIIENHVEVTWRIGRFDIGEQGDRAFRVPRSRTARDLLAIA